jgi:hypothetical protein
MKWIYLTSMALLVACSNNDGRSVTKNDKDSLHDQSKTKDPVPSQLPSPRKVYANERFKDVTVEKLGNDKYHISGKGQIFEARFGWVVEDGHNELATGFEDTDAGAPEWGNFDFTVEVKKAKAGSTLHLVIFETSAKDGSRVYELPVPLEY